MFVDSAAGIRGSSREAEFDEVEVIDGVGSMKAA